MYIPHSIRRTLGVLTLAFVLPGCSQSAQSHFDRGNALLEKNDPAAAILEFRNAVKKDPTFAPARLKLADAFLQRGSGADALGEYVRAADLLPKDVDVQLKAGSLLLMAGKPQEALARADTALAVNARNADALVLRANALAGLADVDGAVRQIQEAIALDPTASRQTNLGMLQLVTGRRDEAEAAFRQAVSADPKSVEAQLALANFLWVTGRAEEAESVFRTGLAIDPNNASVNRALATFYVASGRSPEAEAHFKKVAELDDDPAAKFALADFYASAQRRREALAVLEQLTARPDAWAQARTKVAALFYAEGKTADAHRAVDEVIAKQARDATARATRGRFWLAEGKTSEALEDAKLAVQADARNVEAQYLLGGVYLALRNLEGAATAFQEVLRLNPRATAAQVQLAQIDLQRGSLASATQLAEAAAQSEPRSLQPRLILARSLLARGDLDRATATTLELLDLFPEVGAVHAQAGLLALQKNDLGMARGALEKALALDPLLVEPLIALASLDVIQGQDVRARARFDERLQQTPRDSGVLVAAAKTWAATGDAARAEAFLRRAIDADSSNFDAYSLLGHLLASQGRLDEALAEYDKLAARQPASVGPQTLAGLILQAQGKTDEARKRYERLVEMEPRAAVASNNLAWMYASRGEQLDRALQLAQSAKTELPDHPEVNDTLALVYIKRQLPALAIPLLRLAIEKDPKNASFHYHLGLALSQTGEKAAARQALEQALRLQADFDEADQARQVLESLG